MGQYLAAQGIEPHDLPVSSNPYTGGTVKCLMPMVKND